MPIVTITVTDKAKETPIAEARITVRNRTTILYQDTTDDDGQWQKDLLSGPYRVSAEAFGKPPETQSIQVQEMPVNRTLPLDVGLKCTAKVKKDGPQPLVQEGEVNEGQVVILIAEPTGLEDVNYAWVVESGSLVEKVEDQNRPDVHWDTTGLRGHYTATVTASETGSARITAQTRVLVVPRGVQRVDTVPVSMRRTASVPTTDLPLWVVIRNSNEAISFAEYSRFMDIVLCGIDPDSRRPLRDQGASKRQQSGFDNLSRRRSLPYNDADAYRLLKVATEAFLMVNCGVGGTALRDFTFSQVDIADIVRRVSVDGRTFDAAAFTQLWLRYLENVNGISDGTLPYLAIVRDKLRDQGRLKRSIFAAEDESIDLPEECFGILSRKLTNPCLLELIWSYWHEEGMLVQTMNALSLRFQNVRGPVERDPLVMLEIDPLRPLNNLIWGHIQDEQHRLTVVRRAYEYDHHYGLTLQGKAVPTLRTADSRSKFLEAFHNLLYLCWLFFKEDDDTTVIADGFPILNGLKEVHLLLSEGAHNQFGDLPSTARQEMLIQQWLLARPEFREFLPTRIMVAYPEPWMDRVDAMKRLQAWTDVSVREFHDLGVQGERILLSIRFGAWLTVDDPVQAANWARFWRPEIQGYIHSYRSVTGVDLTTEVTDARQSALRSAQPSILLRERLAVQQRQLLGSQPGVAMPSVPARGRPVVIKRN
jgi:hypothetical protein